MKNTRKIELCKEQREQQAQTECCVICHADTNVNVNTPVSERFGYVDGAGQLCPRCYQRIMMSEIM